MAVDATNYFTKQQLDEIKALFEINAQLKELEAKKKVLSDSIKQTLLSSKIDATELNGNKLTITTSTRRTIAKAKKDKFISELVGMNKKHLVNYSVEPDLDSIFAEVDAGTLGKDFVEEYVTVTPITTLKCN